MEQVLRYESVRKATYPRVVSPAKIPAAVMTGLHWIAGNVRQWSQRIRQRQALAELDDHLLKDIGVSRTAARIEATRPFWK